jgi:hypothetical protein
MPGRDRGRSRSSVAGRLRSAVHSPVSSSPPEGMSTDALIRESIARSWWCRHSVSVTTAALDDA